MKIAERHAPAEESDLDCLDSGAAQLNAGFDLTGRIFLGKRQRRRAETQDHNDGGGCDGGFPHGSASGCLAGCAASKAGCFMQVA